jgi:hypothetical protein
MLGGMARVGDGPAHDVGFRSGSTERRRSDWGCRAFPPHAGTGQTGIDGLSGGDDGRSALNANASLSLQRMSSSANVNLPSIMQMLMELLGPLIDPLLDLLALLHSFNAVQTAFGINLAVPGAMPRLSATLAAAGQSAANGGQARFAGRHESRHLRTHDACRRGLGFNLAKPGVGARFSAAMELAAGLPIPPDGQSAPDEYLGELAGGPRSDPEEHVGHQHDVCPMLGTCWLLRSRRCWGI